MSGIQMIGNLLKNRKIPKIPKSLDFYLNQVKKMRDLSSNTPNTNTLFESATIRSVYQSAASIGSAKIKSDPRESAKNMRSNYKSENLSANLIAQDISSFINKKRSFRSIFSQIVRKIPRREMEGIRVCCSGRLMGAEKTRYECGKFGKTSRNVIDQKMDYAFVPVFTRYGTVGVKVWLFQK